MKTTSLPQFTPRRIALTPFVTSCLVLFISTTVGVSCTKKSSDSADNSQATAQQAEFERLTQEGLSAFQQGDLPTAEAKFQAALKIDANSAVAWNNVCSIHNARQQWLLGEATCRKALELNPQFEMANNNLVYAREQYTKFEEDAMKRFKALKKSKTDDTARINIGLEFYKLGAYEKSAQLWSQIGENSSEYARAQNNVATSYIQMKRFAEAETALQNALKLVPQDATFLANKKWLEEARAAKP